jgi:MFS superfamily sulfate permease-like transporter
MELSWAVVAFLGVLFFGTLRGIVVAIIVSVIALASQAARPAVHILARKPGSSVIRALSPEHPGDETLDGLLMLRPEGRLFFMNAEYVGERIQGLVGEHNPAVLAIDMSRVIDLEYTSTTALQEWERRLTEQGVEVWLCGMNPAVLDVARRSGLADALGDRMVINIREVINRYESRSTASQTKERSDG